MEEFIKHHTPGEWKTGHMLKLSVGVGNVMIAESNVDYDIPEAEQRANAILISAAPDLLDACIEALKYHQGGHSEIGYKLRDAIQKAITQS